MSRESKDGGHIKAEEWDEHASTVESKPIEEIYTEETMVSTGDPRTSLDPKDITKRECLPSEACPNPTPIIIAFDITGSMEPVIEAMIKEVLGPVLMDILEHKAVSDPQIMLMAVGDANHESTYEKRGKKWEAREMDPHNYRIDDEGVLIPWLHDRYPLQMTQFEIDKRILEQLSKICLQNRNGGGNMAEGYGLAMYAAATKVDSHLIKEGQGKGIFITIGDEMLAPSTRKGEIKMVFGDNVPDDLSAETLEQMVDRSFDHYHIVIQQGHNYEREPEGVEYSWRKVLGQRVSLLSNIHDMGSLITTILRNRAGENLDDILENTSKSTALVVRKAMETVAVTTTAGRSVPAVYAKGGGGLVRPEAKPH